MADDVLVYVVEDDAAMLDALSVLLRSAGFQCRCFPTTEAFLHAADLSQPLCLLTDVRLPGKDGLELYRYLVAAGCDPAVIVITGHGDVPMAVAALKDGVMDFVEKTVRPERSAREHRSCGPPNRASQGQTCRQDRRRAATCQPDST